MPPEENQVKASWNAKAGGRGGSGETDPRREAGRSKSKLYKQVSSRQNRERAGEILGGMNLTRNLGGGEGEAAAVGGGAGRGDTKVCEI